jgi:DNA-binding GntR family transcriptional regulator
MSETIEYEDLSEKVYRRLLELILDGELAPGERLRQEELSSRLGVSRTPLLFALTRLKKEMLVEFVPRKGAFVRCLDKEEILNLFDIRIRLETLGARGAALSPSDVELQELRAGLDRYRGAISGGDFKRLAKADFDFHQGIMRMSGNELLIDLVESHHIVFLANQRGIILKPERSLADHETILAAIARRDPAAAEVAMDGHLSRAREAWAAAPEIGGAAP